MAYLYNTIVEEFGKRTLACTQVPDTILDNLRSSYYPRSYQIEAFQRFILCYKESFVGKPPKPLHLLYNMATGSGKTLIMAGLMLYLYGQGYRNFLFFVNSNNIIKKTKDNFLNSQASKYLFNSKIVIDSRAVYIKEVESFEETDRENINIKFTTIQKLHEDLVKTVKENSITFEDFDNKKFVLIADEAHHLNAGTKKNNLFDTWEGTVLKILGTNIENILLEFTATLDYESREIVDKYQNKVIYKYDLAQFRLDKYSKEINLVRSHYEERERIIQALVLNLYRQELATSYNINLKPVILFKAQRTIAESKNNKANFHILIENLSPEMVENLQQTSTVSMVQKAFLFFKVQGLSNTEIVKRIQFNFKEQNCISANSEAETEKNQILLNTLEDENNPIRAVFAVQKLNEGWDVLNLFDIVRLYESRDAKAGKPGKTTMAEAQLIGRGARYFPFTTEVGQNTFTRKFDDDIANDLKILEELYYHTKEDSRYISELKKALVSTGIYEDDENLVRRTLELKPEFKQSDFYQKGQVVFNTKVPKSYHNIRSFSDLGVKKRNIRYILSSGVGSITRVFNQKENVDVDKVEQKDILVKNIPKHVIRFALSQNPFYYFDNLVHYFPHVGSLSHFIDSEDYLAGLEITFNGVPSRLKDISHHDYLLAIRQLLATIETEVKSHLTEYEGSDYVKDYFHKIFKDKKEIKVFKNSERADGQSEVVSQAKWYVYNANYGTSEEKEFVTMFARRLEFLEKKYEYIYLVRNERDLKIFDEMGRAFEPDFLLFCKSKEPEIMTYQVFIEPKGGHLMNNKSEAWKEELLQKIKEENKMISIDSEKYLIKAVSFYNYESENKFKKELATILNIK